MTRGVGAHTHGAEEVVRHLHRYETDPGTGRRGGTS